MDAADIAYAGIGRQAQLLAAGEISARELVELYLQRIERYDPLLNAFRIVRPERALMEAEQADARRRAAREQSEERRRPLLGVPIAIKDDIDLAGEITAFGTRANERPAGADAQIVARARAAGAIILGKTNVPELCAVPWTESPTYGATRNPWNREHTPGGSSGGSAAAVAAGLIGAALGSDGGGSIRFPAAYCSLFGLKAQRGRLPLAPHLDACQGLSVNGALTRSVEDTALLYDILAQGPADPGVRAPASVSLLDALRQGPGRLRVGVARNLPPSPLTKLDREHEQALEQSAELLRSLGHEVQECELDHRPIVPEPDFTVRFLRGMRDDALALDHPERLERKLRRICALAGLFGGGVIGWARARERHYAQRINAPFERFDILLTPVTPKPPPRIGHCEGRGFLYTLLFAAATVPYAAPWNVTGQPAAALPAGLSERGLPLSVQLVAPPEGEARIVALAAQLQAARDWTPARPPGFE
jgi:amidase